MVSLFWTGQRKKKKQVLVVTCIAMLLCLFSRHHCDQPPVEWHEQRSQHHGLCVSEMAEWDLGQHSPQPYRPSSPGCEWVVNRLCHRVQLPDWGGGVYSIVNAHMTYASQNPWRRACIWQWFYNALLWWVLCECLKKKFVIQYLNMPVPPQGELWH